MFGGDLGAVVACGRGERIRFFHGAMICVLRRHNIETAVVTTFGYCDVPSVRFRQPIRVVPDSSFRNF